MPIGGSDFHRHGSGVIPGSPTTWIECEDRSVEGVLDALRHGRTAISATPDGPLLLRVDDEVIAIDADGGERVVDGGVHALAADDRIIAISC